jgi:hypothetical protein
MEAARKRKWDIAIGAAASVIALAGLGVSITVGNTESAGLGDIDPRTQKQLAAVAATFLILVAIKAGIRFRNRPVSVCSGGLEQVWRRFWRPRPLSERRR